MRSRIILLLWVLGILFPIAWLGRFSLTFNRLFNNIFAPTWMHVVMHAFLYAVLVILFVGVFIPSKIFTNHDRSHPPLWARITLILVVAVFGIGLLQETLQALNQGYIHIPGLIEDLGVDLMGGLAGILISYGLFFRKSKAY